MISGFLREQKRYTKKELCQIMQCSEEKAVPLIRKLKEYGVLNTVKASDVQMNMSNLLEEDIEIADVEAGESEYLYVFTFVGVIIVAGLVLKCYPKYILNVSEPKEELKTVLKVLKQYNSKEQIVRMWNESSEGQSFNLLAVMLFLLNDYYENGTYSNTEDIIESNGDFYYFKKLHECLITVASKELYEADLLDLFEITGADLSDGKLDDFGDKEYILSRIEKELSIQFNTRKKLVLKAIYAYVDRQGSIMDSNCLSMFGTNSFNLIWEDVCKNILDNKLEEPLEKLKLPKGLKTGYNGQDKLIDLIEKPLWATTGKYATDTLVPDIISIDGGKFVIFDIRYYNAAFNDGESPKGQPGIEAITKQYLYQLAYKNFIKDHGFNKLSNCFLLPTDCEFVLEKGEVVLKMLEELGLQNIKVRYIPAKMAYQHYLAGTKMKIDDLKL